MSKPFYYDYMDPNGDMKPSPEQISLFREKPEEAAGVFRQLFYSNKSLKLLAFMHAFPFTDPTPKQQALLWLSGFPLALLDSVTDTRWYESFRVLAASSQYGQVATVESVRQHNLILSLEYRC